MVSNHVKPSLNRSVVKQNLAYDLPGPAPFSAGQAQTFTQFASIHYNRTTLPMTSKAPVISIVIAAHNEEALLPMCLQSIAAQDFPYPYEIIVVDNASSDRTAEIAKCYGARVIIEPHLGLARACRTGFAYARAPIIARTDADTIVPTQWLRTISTYFAQHPEVVGISGPTFPLECSRTASLFFYPANVLWMYIEKLLGNGFFFANMAVRRNAYCKSGGFDPSCKFGEDAGIGKRVSSVGKVTMVLSMYIYVSMRRVKAMGLFAYLTTYAIANYILTWMLRKDPIATEPVRVAPRFATVPKHPYLYLCTLPVSLLVLSGTAGFLQTTRGGSMAREVIADTKGVVTRQQANLRRGVTFIKNVKQNSLRYYQHWNRKESSYYPSQFPPYHQS